MNQRMIVGCLFLALAFLPASLYGQWSDNFDSYSNGQDLHGVNGWKGWDNTPANSALVSNLYASSAPNSVAIAPAGPSDLVHEYSTYGSGQYIFSADTYVPLDSIGTGTQYFILLNTYEDGGTKNWSLQQLFDFDQGLVSNSEFGGQADIIWEEWVPIQVHIDLDANTQSFTYGSTTVFTGASWTEGVSGGGALDIAAVDLWNNGAGVMYYDNMSLIYDQGPTVGVLTIDRDTGELTLSNNTTEPMSMAQLSIFSSAGALNPTGWIPITGNYDSNGNSSVSSDEWSLLSSLETELSESTLGTGILAPGQEVDLGTAWSKYVEEVSDIQAAFIDKTTNESVNIFIEFVGNNGEPFEVGDLNFDGAINALDWPIYRNGYRADLSASTTAAAYLQGDLNFDGENNRDDFALFKALYEAANGQGSFSTMLAGVPEPATWTLLLWTGMALVALRCRRRLCVILMGGIAATICFVATGSGTARADLPYLISHWTLDADGSDASGTNNGTPASVTFGQPGANANTGTAALFDGSTSTIDVPYSVDLNPTSFTAVLWANAAVTGDTHHSPLTCRDDYNSGESTHGYIIYNAPNGNWEFWTGQGAGAWGSVSGGAVSTNTWTHLAITFNSATNTKSFYVDGSLIGSTTAQGYSPNGTVESENLHIGSGNDFGDNYYFNGLIDDVAVFNGVLSTAEIQHVRDQGVAEFEYLRLTLQVDQNTGATSLHNDTGFAIGIDQYEILSAGNALNASGWYSLQDQDYEGGGGTSGEGDGWEELGTPGAGFVGEAYLQASSNLADATSISLGSLFNPAGPQDLTFSYRLADGTFQDGVVEYVTDGGSADFDDDGDVDGADFLAWQVGFGITGTGTRADGDANGDTNVNDVDLAFWKAQFGIVGGANDLAGAGVPEPSTLVLILLGCAAAWIRRRR